MNTALIVGSEGQDGTYLGRLLREKGYEVIGVGHGAVTTEGRVQIAPVDIRNRDEVLNLIRNVRPACLYYLAAFHHSSEDFLLGNQESLREMLEVNTLALNNVLSVVASASPNCRVFYAASSLVFGDPVMSPQNEDTPLAPICPYGISKTAGIHVCNYYRAARNLYASVGVLYNHESPLRRPTFISRKISRGVAGISRGETEKLIVGDLETRVDWGYAPDYVEAMYQILRLDEPGLFVIGSGVLHTVRDFLRIAFAHIGLNWEDHVIQDPTLLRRSGSPIPLCADSTRLRARTGWHPAMSFEGMVRLMVDSDMRQNTGHGGSEEPPYSSR
ncbi:MAG TPA: GDP-mannose 4,6-dehydratase [Terriglobales bacterium]|nr:GDP-mannose 4,6-dehydratase [Terriglobales bacterium]